MYTNNPRKYTHLTHNRTELYRAHCRNFAMRAFPRPRVCQFVLWNSNGKTYHHGEFQDSQHFNADSLVFLSPRHFNCLDSESRKTNFHNIMRLGAIYLRACLDNILICRSLVRSFGFSSHAGTGSAGIRIH